MKRINARLFAPAVKDMAATLAATLVLTFGTVAASAQTTRGNIPFGFTVTHKNMAPGAYAIAPVSRYDSGEPLVLRNLTDGSTVIAGVVTHEALVRDEKPRIEFLCAHENCRLVRVYSRTTRWDIVQPGRNKAEVERLATIYLATESAH